MAEVTVDACTHGFRPLFPPRPRALQATCAACAGRPVCRVLQFMGGKYAMSLTPQRASRSTRWSPSCACQVKSPGETRGDWKCEGGSPAPAGAGDGFADTDAPPAPRACASKPGRRILTLVSKSGKSFFRTIESSFQRFKSPVSSRRRRCRGGGRLPRSPCKWRFSEEHSSATILGPVNHRPRKPRLCVSQQAGAPAGSGTRPRARRPRREGGS